MAATVSITPTAQSDGIPYAVSVPLTSTEADLNGGTGAIAGPVATAFGQAMVAVVQLTINGFVTANNTYIVMQIDMGDGTWIDINWLVWNQVQGTATFVFSNGIAGANTFQNSRNSNSAPNPQSSSSNQLCLGGRIRFVGKTIMGGGSSISPGATTMVSVTIRYKLLGLS